MTDLQAIRERHSVRSYTDDKLSKEATAELKKMIVHCNEESGMKIRLVTDEPKAFGGLMSRKFSGVRNYIVLAGNKSDYNLDERVGYYGEKIAIKAQTLGLNTCWVAMSFSKSEAKKNSGLDSDDKIVCVLSVGKGTDSGVPHKSKQMSELCSNFENAPEWFKSGMEAALLAPTAMNQQKFFFSFNGDNVTVKSDGGFYSYVDLGIVKYHFEVGAGKENFKWKQ
ncbi:MAG: nitroreductase family protein [Clostridia bacterium]|nr:nitroreductase family protein [Clostridia bacterium]